MNAARIAAAGLLAAGAYVLWQRGALVTDATADYAPTISDITDSIAETVTAYTGIDMQSSRYADALTNPKNAAIIGYLTAAEADNGIPAGLLVRQAWQESRFNPAAVNRSSGAAGLMQFMPATAQEWGVERFDAESSAKGAGRYMAWLYRQVGSWPLALAAYNWGVGNLKRKGLDAAPAETRDYVAQIGAALGLA